MAQKEESGAPVAASTELVRRCVDVILAQTRAGAATSTAAGLLLGLVLVPAAGWFAFGAWFAVLAGCMFARQPYFRRLVRRDGATEATLRRIARVASVTSWLGPLAVPLFSPMVTTEELGLLSVILVGWIAVAVAVLAVQPRIYAGYLVASLATVFAGWIGQGTPRELLLIGVAMLVGGPMLVRLAHIVHAQMSDAVASAQQREVLVGQLRDALANQQETLRARSRFLGAASHDLRQPVQALLFLADIFRRSTDPVRRDAMAQQIVRTGESIDGMFRHLVDFAANLHPDDEKEDSHQGIIDPEVERMGEREISQSDRERHMPKRMIAVDQRGIGPDQCDRGRDQQHDAANGFDVEKTF